MHYNISEDDLELEILHGQHALIFPLKKAYTKQTFKVNVSKNSQEKPLEVINRYLSILSEGEQDEIFSVFQKVSNYRRRRRGQQPEEFVGKMASLAEELMKTKLHPAFMEAWVKDNRPVPGIIQDIYVEETKTTPEKTYLKKDYIEMVAMAMSLKTLVPIWAVFMRGVYAVVGKSNKELSCLSVLPDAIRQYSAYDRLNVFVKATLGDAQPPMHLVTSGTLNAENYSTWVVSRLLFIRLIAATVMDNNDESHIVKFVQRNIPKGNNDAVTNGMYRHKDVQSTGEDGEESSIFEANRVTGNLTVADYAFLDYCGEEEYYLHRYEHLINVDEWRNISNILINDIEFGIYEEHMRIMEWIMDVGNVVKPITFNYLSREAAIKLLALCSLLIRDKHEWASLYLLTNPEKGEDGFYTLPPAQTIKRIDPELQNELISFVPYRTTDTQASYIILRSIDRLAVKISEKLSKIKIPVETRSPFVYEDTLQRPEELKNILSNLYLSVCCREEIDVK